jgi:hypothetical protein
MKERHREYLRSTYSLGYLAFHRHQKNSLDQGFDAATR